MIFGKCLAVNWGRLIDFKHDLIKRESNDHLEQCASVDFIMKQLGVVNVLAFFDASWPFSHKQAAM